jgi:NDP-sugar pyrophosphorylase family protein
MQAVILAGGLGTRLWPLTRTVPKPMVPVAGVPYLEHQLRLLAKQGIRSILILTGYLGEQIEEYFGDGSKLGLAIGYSREQAPAGTGGALRDACEKLAETFLVIYGDSYLPVDYTATLAMLEGSSAAGLLVVYDNRLSDTSVKNNVDVDASGYVTRYEKDSPDPLGYVEAGVLAFRREVVSMIAPEGLVSLEKETFPRLIASRRLIAQITTQRFYDIGTPDRLKAIEEFLAA